jgi:hypothetical protein
MPSVSESSAAPSQLAAGLAEGVNTLSENQTITFIQYARKVLPADGWIFWLNTGNALTAQGSLHYSTRLDQREDETIGINRITFTAEQQIQDFNKIAPDSIYIATVGEIQFAFSDQANFYEQAGLYHYSGDAIYPAMLPQIINSAADLDLLDTVVSNSLPLWLSMQPSLSSGGTLQIYPSFLVPQDLQPPYASIQIGEGDTEALQSAPWFDYEGSHWQLCSDRVKVTIWGLRNNDALDFQDYVNTFSLDDANLFGIMNIPVVRDAKRTQAELGIIGMKKEMNFEINYYQSRVNDISRKFILQSIQTYLPKSL